MSGFKANPTKSEYLVDEVKTLTEIELQAFFELLDEHLTKNKLSHVAYNVLDNYPAIDKLKDEISDLEDELEVIGRREDVAIRKLKEIEKILK